MASYICIMVGQKEWKDIWAKKIGLGLVSVANRDLSVSSTSRFLPFSYSHSKSIYYFPYSSTQSTLLSFLNEHHKGQDFFLLFLVISLAPSGMTHMKHFRNIY